MRHIPAFPFSAILMTATALACSVPASADAPANAVRSEAGPTYADIVDLADSAQQVLRAEVRKMAVLEPERAPGVKPGWARYYIEAETRALIFGDGAVGEKLRYLVDLPLDDRGNPPAIKKKDVLLFAHGGSGRPGEIQLVAPHAQFLWDAGTEERLRAILRELNAADAPPKVAGVQEAIHVPGPLAGEGQTQLFLATEDNSAAAITLTRERAGAPAQWSVSFSEVAAGDGTPPKRDTLEWYRLACFLPPKLDAASNLSDAPAARQQAAADYEQIMADLGPCARMRD